MSDGTFTASGFQDFTTTGNANVRNTCPGCGHVVTTYAHNDATDNVCMFTFDTHRMCSDACAAAHDVERAFRALGEDD